MNYIFVSEMARTIGVSDVRCNRLIERLELEVRRLGRYRLIDRRHKDVLKAEARKELRGRPRKNAR